LGPINYGAKKRASKNWEAVARISRAQFALVSPLAGNYSKLAKKIRHCWTAGLPDFSEYSIPKREKYTK
jgi:hypothetical protein